MTRARIHAPVETRTAEVTLIGHTAPVAAVAFHPDGHLLASGGGITAPARGNRLGETGTGRPDLVFTAGTHVPSVAFSPDGATLAIGDRSGGSALWRLGPDEVTALAGPDARGELRRAPGPQRATGDAPDASLLGPRDRRTGGR